ncbi:MAG: HD-GYP domain-containing protein [Actinobacteria bacterium]|nr:MAG: HD-GYP domain-containing protein [Actinomycetota bacterium]
MTTDGTPRPFRVFAATVVLLGAVLTAASWAARPLGDLRVFVLLCMVSVLSESLAVELPAGGSTSISLPVWVAAAILLGPTGAAMVAASSALNYQDIARRRSPWIFAANLGLLSTSLGCASWAYELLGSLAPAAQAGVHGWTATPAARLIVLVTTALLLNVSLSSVGVSLLLSVPLARVWRSNVSWTLGAQAALAMLGWPLARVLALTPLALALFLFPLMVARQLYQRYVGLRDAYLDTVRSLVAAIEAKDPYTRGHSERVATHAVALGRAAGMPERLVERLEFAALLHDLGKVGIRSSILGKAAQLDPWEVREIRHHPEIGARILEQVPYLADIVPGVLAHHERYDGGGYSTGLIGDAVPLEARILAVADSYDAMTTERPYRAALEVNAATAELRLGAGGQFDPRLVGFFLPLVGDHEPFRQPVAGRPAVSGAVVDNDA